MKSKRYADNFPLEPDLEKLIRELDRKIERGEDILMFGLAMGMFSSLLAPALSPGVLLPALSISFAITTTLANKNYREIHVKLNALIQFLEWDQRQKLQPLLSVFRECPGNNIADEFNPLKNLKRTWKCLLGGVIMNPLWIPIFYTMGMHIREEKNLVVLNEALMKIEFGQSRLL